MKISLTTKKTIQSNEIYLISSLHILPENVLSQQEIEYLAGKHKSKKTIVSFNRYNYQVIIVFISQEKDFAVNMEQCRKAGDDVWQVLKNEKADSASIFDFLADNEAVIAFVEGLLLGSYCFNKYKVRDKVIDFSLERIELISEKIEESEIRDLEILVKATFKARDLVNEPVMTLNATGLADEFSAMAKEAGIEVDVFEKQKIESLKMGGLLGVNLGSVDAPTFTILEWKPDNAVNNKPIVLVGKGVVYDTGGMNIKTGNYMEHMKIDMAGAAAVASAIYAAALAKLPVHIITLVPATDNRVNGNAYVSGDVLTMHSGATVEVINTDAEGRLILADALSFAQQYDPMVVIDMATLTGAASRAIGKYALVGMHSGANSFFTSLMAAGNRMCERIVEFPLWDDYSELLKSDIADIKNLSDGTDAGAITAGKFLEYFTNYPYIHLDIAGPAHVTTRYGYRGVGGTGVGVRLLFGYFKGLLKE